MESLKLRIGNIISVLDTKKREWEETIVYSLKEDAINNNLPMNFKPIKIDESNLKRLGFDVSFAEWFIKFKDDTGDVWYITFKDGLLKLDRNDVTIYDVEFIHELQNAYFMMTKEDLNY